MTILSPVLLFMLLCVTSAKLNKNGNSTALYEIENELKFPEMSGPYKYIFLRLYDVEYSSALNPTNILKLGITCTEVSNIRVSHASINFSLDDNFYALSAGGKYQVAQESCMNTSANKFMKKSNPETSNQITFAMKVSEKEYYDTKKFVESYAKNPDVKYDVLQNFKIAKFATKRKFFTAPEQQALGEVKYPEKNGLRIYLEEHLRDHLQGNIPEKLHISDKNLSDDDATDFVCSTFVAYSLMKNIKWLHDWFENNKIDYNYVTVSDLSTIPGVVRLFSSKFLEYDEAVGLFIEKHPEFGEYYGQK